MIIPILELMMLFQIKVMNGKNSSVNHTQALAILKYIQRILYLKLLFLKLRKDVIITSNNKSATEISVVMMDGVKLRRELQMSQILYYKNQL